MPAAAAQVLDKGEFAKCMLEKLVWICAFMLVGARHGGCTVGEVESQVCVCVRTWRGWWVVAVVVVVVVVMQALLGSLRRSVPCGQSV